MVVGPVLISVDCSSAPGRGLSLGCQDSASASTSIVLAIARKSSRIAGLKIVVGWIPKLWPNLEP